MIHVVPNSDKRPHTLDTNCECGPKIEDEMLIHKAYDAREVREQMHEENGEPAPNHAGWAVVDDTEITQHTWT